MKRTVKDFVKNNINEPKYSLVNYLQTLYINLKWHEGQNESLDKKVVIDWLTVLKATGLEKMLPLLGFGS